MLDVDHKNDILQGMSLGLGISGVAISAISFLTLLPTDPGTLFTDENGHLYSHNRNSVEDIKTAKNFCKKFGKIKASKGDL